MSQGEESRVRLRKVVSSSSGSFYMYLSRLCIRKKGGEGCILLRYTEILPQSTNLLTLQC